MNKYQNNRIVILATIAISLLFYYRGISYYRHYRHYRPALLTTNASALIYCLGCGYDTTNGKSNKLIGTTSSLHDVSLTV